MKKSLLLLCLLPFVLTANEKEDWGRLMIRHGIHPGENLTLDAWNEQLEKINTHAAEKGVHPPADMAEGDWNQLLVQSGVIPPQTKAEPPVPSPEALPSETITLAVPEAPRATAPEAPAPPPIASPPPAETSLTAIRPKINKPISMNFRNLDLIEALKILSDESGLNIVVGQQVEGRVTVFLDRADFWTALDTLLAAQNLAYTIEGNVVRVLSGGEYERQFGEGFGDPTVFVSVGLTHLSPLEAKEILEPFKSRVGALVANDAANAVLIHDTPEKAEKLKTLLRAYDIPMETKVYPLNYAKLEDILPHVSTLVGKGPGRLQSDKRTNSLLVKDNPARLKEIDRLIAAFDAPHRTVLIEAKIVQVTLSDEFQWGINWERAFQYNRSSNPSYRGDFTGNNQILPLSSVNPSNGPVTAAGYTARIMSLGPLEFSAALNFLDTVGKTNLLSSPRLSALNNEPAKILVASQVPKITKTISNIGNPNQPQVTTDNVTFENVGLELFVTPTIGTDGFITLKIKPKVTALENIITTTEGSSIPIIRTSEAETTVVAKDDVTVLIAGLIEDTLTDKKTGIPILNRLPLIGWIFGSKKQEKQKTELVIFLTPKIVTGATDFPSAEYYEKRAPRWRDGEKS